MESILDEFQLYAASIGGYDHSLSVLVSQLVPPDVDAKLQHNREEVQRIATWLHNYLTPPSREQLKNLL